MDNQAFFNAIERDILQSWGGDRMTPTSTRKHDGATIYTVTQNGIFVIAGTMFELMERARLNDLQKRK